MKGIYTVRERIMRYFKLFLASFFALTIFQSIPFAGIDMSDPTKEQEGKISAEKRNFWPE